MSSLPGSVSKNSHSNNGWKQGQNGKDASFQYRPVKPSVIEKMPSETVTFVDIKFLELLTIRLRETVKRFRDSQKRE